MQPCSPNWLSVGIDYATVVADLEQAGVASFIDAWQTLLRLVSATQPAHPAVE